MRQILFRLLLKILPRHRRAQFGDSMQDTFRALAIDARQTRGALGVAVLLLAELRGLMRFSMRERLDAMRDWRFFGGWHPLRELRRSWRGVRSRGWRAILIVGLLSLALAANTIVFAALDALMFTRVPYPNAERLITLGSAPTRLIAEWQSHADLFQSVHGYVTRPVFLMSQDQPEIVDVADVTPGLLESLGVPVRYGRSLEERDTADPTVGVVTISERLARARFGEADRAVGQRLDTTGGPLLVVGVMPPAFRFPSSGFEIWRAIDLRHPRLRTMTTVAVMPPGRSIDATAAATKDRLTAAAARAGVRPPASAVRPLFSRGPDDRSRRLLWIVSAAAICLLLTACANVASLELAGAVSRVRTFGIHAALGASRASLVRGALLEGVVMLTPAVLLAIALAEAGVSLLAGYVPDRIFDSVNPIDVDRRALGFMALATIGTWLLISVPLAMFAARGRAIDLLNTEGRTTSASSGGTRARQILTVAEVALAALLLTSGVLYARSYLSMLAIDKGFDSRNLWAMTLTLPTQTYPTPRAARLLEDDITHGLLQRGDVEAIWSGGPLPPSRGEAHSAATFEVDGRGVGRDGLAIGVQRVDARYFPTLRIPIRAGRAIDAAAQPNDVVIDESLARAFWPDRDPLGRSLRISKDFPAMTVIGVAGHVFNVSDELSGPSDSFFQIYVPRQPVPPAAGAPRMIDDQPLYGSIDFALRLAPSARAAAIAEAVRTIDSRFRLRLRSFDDVYAARFEDTRVATSLVSAFAVLAFAISMAGIYGVMAYLVAGRRREIGIRLALGADRAAIGRLVLGSSGRLVVAGALLGTAAALAASRWMASQFFGIAPTQPSTHVLVAAVVVVTALAASWGPARRAARTDPAITLRNS